MNQEKLSGDKVPQKFAEWLLTMGCPSDKVPSVEKLAEMCRGQYYMVWRSLMEHVEPKDSIKRKRMQVFIDDIQKCQKRNAFCKPDPSVVVPEELTLWEQQAELKDKLAAAETRVKEAKLECNKLMEKVSSKLSHRNLAREKVQNSQRRAYLLQQVAEELRNKKANLLETRSIAESLCHHDDSGDIESKLEKCTSNRRQNTLAASSCSSTLQNSITSIKGDLNDSDEFMSLGKCSGEVLWPQLCERRAALISALNVNKTTNKSTENKGVSPQWVLAHTASLHSLLALEALKNEAHIEQARTKLCDSLALLNDCISGDACELFVCKSEQARMTSRVTSLRALLDDVTTRSGCFALAADGAPSTNCAKLISVVDKNIIAKRDELKKVLTSLSVTDRKIQNVRECLIALFNSFQTEVHPDRSFDRFRSQITMPQESISSIKKFYEENREKTKNNMELSLEFETDDICSDSDGENPSPKFIDELKVYLKKFNLENNRKLILESGEKIWIFESVKSCISRLHTRLQEQGISCSLLCPSVSFDKNLQTILQLVQKRQELDTKLKVLQEREKKGFVFDITSKMEEEQNTTDKIKKRLNENLLDLKKTVKTLDLGQENLKLWSENQMRKYISTRRSVEGRNYKDYESCYMENLNLNI